MKKNKLVPSFMLFILVGIMSFSIIGCSSDHSVKSIDPISNQITNDYINLPIDITPVSQAAADTFSWKTFIAMNWPADLENCGPDTNNGMNILSGKGPVVWESYLSSDQVFVSSPSSPNKWCVQEHLKSSFKRLPKKVQDLAHETGVYRFIHRASKAPHGLDQASGQPLVDQNGRFVRYEIRMNMDEYNYIIDNDLWNKDGQNEYVKDSTIFFPNSASSYGPIGAMEIKAAWKIMGSGDDPSRFYTIRAIVYNDEKLTLSPGDNPVTLGLVGLHIARKTPKQNNWVWSTFEQVDNLTSSFPHDCDTCAVNQPPSGGPDYKELDTNGNPLHDPTQVTRVNQVDSSADPFVNDINQHFQSLLNGSVWSNYKLISTQWLFFETMTPLYLANVVQETYLQGSHPASWGNFPLQPGVDVQYFQDSLYQPFSPGVSSSCMGCHFVATLPDSNKVKADFSFMLGNAR